MRRNRVMKIVTWIVIAIMVFTSLGILTFGYF